MSVPTIVANRTAFLKACWSSEVGVKCHRYPQLSHTSAITRITLRFRSSEFMLHAELDYTGTICSDPCICRSARRIRGGGFNTVQPTYRTPPDVLLVPKLRKYPLLYKNHVVFSLLRQSHLQSGMTLTASPSNYPSRHYLFEQ